MAEYIEREALVENLRELHKAEIRIYNWAKSDTERRERISGCIAVAECIVQAKEAPTADVVEVRHGEWVDKFNRNRMATQSFCSVCGERSGIGGIESNRHKPYCPNCGAKMDGKGD